jgi:multiple antibiotic resistance protein
VVAWDDIRQFAQAVISIFAIVNPIGSLPLFVSLTEDLSNQERRSLLRLAGVTSLVILCVMAVAGQYLLRDVFHIDLAEFMFGGGLILIVVGIMGIVEKPEARHSRAGLDPRERRMENIRLAVSPIASPLLVGPGSIVTVMLIVSRHGVLYGLAASLAAFVFVILILNYTNLAYRLMGRVGSIAVGRVMDIFIVAIGVNFVFSSIKAVFPALGK